MVTDGAPSEVVIRLDGLTGRAGIGASGAVGFDSEVMTTRVDAPAKAVYSAGGSGKFETDDGLIFSYMVIVNRAWVASEFGRCVGKGAPSGPEPLAWALTCPTADDPMVETMQYGPDEVGIENGKGFYSTTAGLQAGTYTLSHWYEAASVVDRRPRTRSRWIANTRSRAGYASEGHSRARRLDLQRRAPSCRKLD